jgi:Phosphoesterase family
LRFDRLGPRVGAVVISPYVIPGVDHTRFEHASIPATVTQQCIGSPRDDAPFRREQHANPLLPLLAPVPPRMDWPRYTAGAARQPAPQWDAHASALQAEHVYEVYAALAHLRPDMAHGLDPTTVRTKKDVAAFIGQAMRALHPGVGHA